MRDRLATALATLTVDLTVAVDDLADGLYAQLHTGHTRDRFSPKRDRQLEALLAAAVPHETTTVTGVLKGRSEGRVLVELDDVLVWFPEDAVEGEHVRVPAVRPALSPGFLYVTSSRPAEFTDALQRVYVHVTNADDAPDVWHAVLTALERAKVTYHAKILSRREEYPRRDALVVYLPGLGADLVASAVLGLPGIGVETSVFADELAPGVAVAEEPDDTRLGMSGLSFGQHRSRVLAQALLRAGGEPRELVVAREFELAGIDPANPARNLVAP
ncbi:T3SS effector HopA1 family protein [Lentzea sp. BCCO 10_0798]|uniref:T3SS effector HopA1 family protein n=1 Tax=Lentzea kristufekii TaxID=3095430 RepID=A0ABU4TNR2_9PSEU|nr:T3SS effector HopA1 family protein [Lentzea sp. BCCO 10_0798]MDX8049930.1 T3SS effector HopA1 family protein [Lentzea sp. BCCO 10_0798]